MPPSPPSDLGRGVVLQILACIGGWYLFSSLLSISNKRLFGQAGLHFDFPLLVTATHSGIQWLVSAFLVRVAGRLWLSPAQRTHLQRTITWREWLLNIAPCGFTSSLEIAMANAALMFITLSFYTMVKSSTPIWVLTFAFLLQLERMTVPLILQIALICFGVALTVVGETQFHLVGFLLVLGASVASGFRWSITQILLKKASLGLDHPILTMYRLAPVMFITMCVFSTVIENPIGRLLLAPPTTTGEWSDGEPIIPAADDVGRTTGIVVYTIVGGFLALAMIICEFRLIQLTSTVTLSVCGIAKEILMIALSMLVFGDKMTPLNTLGLVISIIGILYYNLDRWRSRTNPPPESDYSILPPTEPPSHPLTAIPSRPSQ
ncbi:triose-phosphate transporter family-domain-containing protein [Dimargaris cristalligena]|uniref:Triose-phosphate transporter family-domain-containing protein n=1 Tax=Dimargaris cristalligena TaxID=215637 RepID=A0A4V1J4N1_9FUNG|nr:triose-phosphate transporter family-domain-containing protein [Dimargaris cristalligena]|eukprot:RKP36139.1 triose-phosphate transporter family-domain-containing protein [Dimargaris cristalligena]